MRLVRVNLRPGVQEHDFPLFPNAETMYSWIKTYRMSPQALSTFPNVEVVTLDSSNFIEVEWLGNQYVYEDASAPGGFDTHGTRISAVRLMKSLQLTETQDPRGMLSLMHAGWVVDDVLPLRSVITKDYVVQPINVVDSQLGWDVIMAAEVEKEESLL
jgi:hypothetical protein